MFIHAETTSNGISFSGGGWTKNEVPGNLTGSLEFSRCSLDLKFCEKWQNVNVKEVCAKFVDKNMIYSVIMNAIKPKLECPIKSGNYTLDQTSLDLSALRLFPVAGYIWVLTAKFISYDKQSKTKNVVLCFNAELKITTGTKRLK